VVLVWIVVVGNSILEVAMPELFTVFESIKMFGHFLSMSLINFDLFLSVFPT